MPSTRKMPVRIADRSRTTVADEHLIPSLDEPPGKGFVSANTGKGHARGAVVYLGRDVTPEMMLERYVQVARPPVDRSKALWRLGAYCEALQSVKIGSVVSLSFSPDGLPLLNVDEEHFLSGQEHQLP